jgi:methylenetetrahydrofolate dehydrogenase (NADP+)/methenyltetrahydrofolate cyclohydrolase
MLTCKEYAELKKKELKKYIEDNGLKPCLVVIQVGDRPESNSYIRGKMRDCEEVGIEYKIHKYSDNVDQKLLEGVIKAINMNDDVHGIILQLPVPEHIDVKRLQKLIYPSKDVDGFNKLSNFDPCTPKGVIDYLKYNNYEFEGKDALVIGRSDIVGKPLARMLTDLDCTVTLAHSMSRDLDGKIAYADIVFTAINAIEYFDCTDFPISPDTDVIDIGLGISSDGKLHGNIDRDQVDYIKKLQFNDRFIISGTGGVGLLTRLALLENVVKAAELNE